MLKSLPPDLSTALCTVSLTFTLEQFLTNDTPAIQNWCVEAVAHDWDRRDDQGRHPEESVAHINIVKGSLVHAGLWEQLDALSSDLEWVGGSLLDPAGDLREDLAETLQSAGSTVVILNSVELAARWRGYGVGAYLAGEALLAMDGDAHCVATVPAPLDGSEGAQRERAIRNLERVWAQLEFQPYRDGVWILDPGMVPLQDAVNRMKVNFGLT